MDWPQSNGGDSPTALDPIQRVRICKDCWNGKHARRGSKCPEPSCRCACSDKKGPKTPTLESASKDELLKPYGTITI